MLRKNQKGQALTEFALILPILLLVILGIIEGAWIIWAYITVQNAAREGARYAVTGAPLNPAGDPWSYTPEERADAIKEVVRKYAAGLPIDAYADQGTIGQDIDTTDYIQDFNRPRTLGILIRGQTAQSIAEAEANNEMDQGVVYHPGEKGLNILVRVYYNVAMLDPIYDTLMGGNSIHLSGEVVLQNEGINLALGGNLPAFAGGNDDTTNTDTNQNQTGTLEIQQQGIIVTDPVPAGEDIDFALSNHQGGKLYYICSQDPPPPTKITHPQNPITTSPGGSALLVGYTIPLGTSEGPHTFSTHLNDPTCADSTKKAEATVIVAAPINPAITISDPGHDPHQWPDNSLVDVAISTHNPNASYQVYFDGAKMLHDSGADCIIMTDAAKTGTATDCVIPDGKVANTYSISTTFATNTVEVSNGTLEVQQGSTVTDKRTVDLILREHAPDHDYWVYFGPNLVDSVTTNSDGDAVTSYFIDAGVQGPFVVQSQDRVNPASPSTVRQIASTPVTVTIPTGPVIIAPDSSPAGEVIKIQLRKHSPNTTYKVKFAQSLAATVTTDAAGDTTEFTYQIPITMQGVKMIRSYLGNSGSFSATHNINVLPVPFIEIQGGDRHSPGEKITISLKNHTASTAYDVYLDLNSDGILSANELIKDNIVTDGSGNRSFDYTIPTDITPLGLSPTNAHPIVSKRGTNEVARTNLFAVAADLRVTLINPPDAPQPGIDLPIALSIKNDSAVTLTNFPFDNDLYVNPLPGIPNYNTSLPPGNEKVWIRNIGPNQTVVITPVINVFNEGTYKLYGRTDTSDGVVESLESNNILSTTMTLVCTLTPFVDNFDDNIIGASWTLTKFGDADAPAPSDVLTIQAEDATYGSNYTLVNNGSASGGKYLEAGGSDHTTNISNLAQDKATFNFVVGTPGIYRLRGRVLAPSSNDDSFWVKVAGFSQTRLWDVQQSSSFVDDWVNDRNVADPVEWSLNAGTVTVEVWIRENGTGIDWLELVPESEWASSPQKPAELLALHSPVDPATLKLSELPPLPALQAASQPLIIGTTASARNDNYKIQPAIFKAEPAAIPQQQAILNAPTNLSAAAAGQTQVNLSWQFTANPGGAVTYIDDNFASNASGWTYGDITNGSHVDGQYTNSGGNPPGSLQVLTGGNGADVTNGIAGGWSKSFNLLSPQAVTLKFDYRLRVLDTLENDECGEIRYSIDGGAAITVFGPKCGGGDWFPWGTFSTTANLSAGNHTITLIGYNNKKTASDEQVTALFDNVQASATIPPGNPTAFEVERSLNGTSWSPVATVPYPGVQASYTYSDTNAQCGTQYFYRVKAIDANSSSGYSNQANATTAACDPFSAPTNLAVTVNGSNGMDLSWQDNSNNETEFRIERSLDGSSWTQIATVAGNNSTTPQTLSYTDNSANCETQYFYRVIAYRSSDGAVSAPTNVDNDTTGTCPPPTALCTISGESNGILTLCSSGSGILQNSDANGGYVFMNRPVNSAAFEMVVRLDSVPSIANQSLAGLEVRNTLAPNAKKVELVIRHQNTQKIGAYRRAAVGGAVAQVGSWTDTGGDIPTWLRIVRANGYFYFYYNATTEESPVLGAWTLLGSTPDTMPPNVFVGLINSSATSSLSPSTWQQFRVGCLAAASSTCGVVSEEGGQVVVDAINYTDNFKSTSSSDKWTETNSTSGGYAAMTYIGSDYPLSTYRAAPMLEYSVDIQQSGSYYLWLLAYTTDSADTIHLGLDGARLTLMEDKAGTGLRWFNTNGIGQAVLLNLSQGIHTINIWGAEDGFQLVQLLLTTQPPGAGGFTPSGNTPLDQSACMLPVPPEFPPNLKQCVSVLQNGSFENGTFGDPDFAWVGSKVIHGSSAYVPPNESSSFGILMQGRIVGNVPVLYQTFEMPSWINDQSTAKLTLYKHVNQLPNPPDFIDKKSPDDVLRFMLQDANGANLTTPIILATGADDPDGDTNYANSTWRSFPLDNTQDNDVFNFFIGDPQAMAGQTVRAYFDVPNNDINNPYSTDFAVDIVKLEICTTEPAPPAEPGQGAIQGQLTVFINGALKAIQGVPVWAYKIDGPLHTTYTVNTPPGSKNYGFYNLDPGIYVVYAQFIDSSGVSFGASASVNVTAGGVAQQNLLLVLGGS